MPPEVPAAPLSSSFSPSSLSRRCCIRTAQFESTVLLLPFDSLPAVRTELSLCRHSFAGWTLPERIGTHGHLDRLLCRVSVYKRFEFQFVQLFTCIHTCSLQFHNLPVRVLLDCVAAFNSSRFLRAIFAVGNVATTSSIPIWNPVLRSLLSASWTTEYCPSGIFMISYSTTGRLPFIGVGVHAAERVCIAFESTAFELSVGSHCGLQAVI